MRIVIDVCKICDKKFEKTSNNQVYCSLGCQHKSRSSYFKDWVLKRPDLTMLARAKNRAKKKNLEFNLTLDDIKIPAVCPIFGLPIRTNQTGKSGYYPDSPSLDRIDNNKGYIKGNVRVISNRANQIKSDATIEELELILKYLRTHV